MISDYIDTLTARGLADEVELFDLDVLIARTDGLRALSADGLRRLARYGTGDLAAEAALVLADKVYSAPSARGAA